MFNEKFRKNREEYIEHGIITEIAVRGKTLSDKSDLYTLRFEGEMHRKLIFHGETTFVQDGEVISSYDLNEELVEFFSNEIRGAIIDHVQFHRKTGKLEICLRAESGPLEIHVDPEASRSGESWQYDVHMNNSIVY